MRIWIMSLVQRKEKNIMRIKIEIFHSSDIVAGERPDRTYQFRLSKNGATPLNYIRRQNDLEDQLQYFLEDYADFFEKEIKRKDESYLLKKRYEKPDRKN